MSGEINIETYGQGKRTKTVAERIERGEGCEDRTRNQMIQAARSCKQNIVEGLSDGVSSTEMQLNLLNVARSSLKELREDYEDYLKSRKLLTYDTHHPAYDAMLTYCRTHNELKDYEACFTTWSNEQMCNYALTLCHMVDKMMCSYLERLDREFVTQGGIKERMYRARTGYRQQQDERLKALEAENPRLQQQIATLTSELAEARQQAQQWQAAYEDLKQRALAAYNRQQEEIARLHERLGEAGESQGLGSPSNPSRPRNPRNPRSPREP